MCKEDFHVFAIRFGQLRSPGFILFEHEPVHFRGFGEKATLKKPHVGFGQVFVFAEKTMAETQNSFDLCCFNLSLITSASPM